MKKKYIITGLISAFVITGITAVYIHINNIIKPYENLIFPNVFIENLNLSGKTKKEALDIIHQKYSDEILNKKINIKKENKNYNINYSKLNAKYNIEETVNEAFEYGKNYNIFKKYKLIKNPIDKKLKLEFTYDPKYIKEFVSDIAKDINKSPVNASLKMISSGKFSITPEIEGEKLNTEKLEKDIINSINNLAKSRILENIEIEAPVEKVQAAITKDVLSKVNTKISSFTTNFAKSNDNRVNNITLATKAINGKLLLPGESFSFNDVVGERTIAKGYKEAGVIINNQLDSGIGGGICQVSTTLYNAIMRANINYIERRHHSLPSNYVAPGLDATVSYGSIDYKFKNTLEYPIYIEGYVKNKNVTFNIYSDITLSNKTYDLVSEIQDTIEPNIKYIDDPNMYEGYKEVITKPITGYKVNVYRNTYENGKLIKKEKLYTETYKKIDGVIKRGTKKKPVAA
ncbi:Vancomycin resistance protein YoaR, contains peptidoglycan-binding and VanW domains [Clostridium sp. USBA 49]|jgi:vancomycin resistance protein YoaR|uniref:VanW family protein n=1 Tax=Clostridium sp. USBA 49 TaxID=1881060 RepID=UPI0009990DC1|nr:VanW family protein [Clostridium sp. USBA 49]SKA73108.1 Vancomycin resistance protein YoaR, contains peptidoglycan-binding and VanW domains [Clostridium sp. USBA 49]